MEKSRALGWSLGALLWIGAAAYFLVAATQGIERVDEGHLVYFSARVADGALPSRDFQHWYGPSVFFLNGLLLRLFGVDLLVVRLGLVAFHATLVVAVYALTRVLAGTLPALVVGLLGVVLGGLPLWVFNTPYATNYQLPLTLGGLAVFVGLPERSRARFVLLGLVLGVVTTFKPTGGILPLLGAVTFVLSRVDRPAGGAGRGALLALAAVTMLAVIAVLGVVGASLGGGWGVALLLGPSLVLALWTLLRLRHAAAACLGRNVGDLCRLGAGFATAPLLLAAWYATEGVLGALVSDVLVELPRQFLLFVPYPPPSARVLVLLALAAAGVVAVAWRRDATGAGVARGVVIASVALCAVALVVGGRAHLLNRGWLGDVFALVFWVPPLAAWAGALLLMRAAAADAPAPAGGPPVQDGSPSPLQGMTSEPAVLVTMVTATLLPGLAPVSDLPHVLLALPAFLPLTVLVLRELRGGGVSSIEDERAVGRGLAWTLAGCWAVVFAVPAVTMLATARASLPAPAVTHPRATWIADGGPRAADLAAAVAYIDKRQPRPERLLTYPTQAMLYFLTGIPSALDASEFAFYAGIAGPQLSDENVLALVDEQVAVLQLATQRPMVVRVRGGQALDVFRRMFPVITSYIGRNYRQVARFGDYDVLEPRALPTAPSAAGTGAPAAIVPLP